MNEQNGSGYHNLFEVREQSQSKSKALIKIPMLMIHSCCKTTQAGEINPYLETEQTVIIFRDISWN